MCWNDEPLRYSSREVAEIVVAEGLGYAVRAYMGPDSIEDPTLAGLWATAAGALKAIEDYLKPYAQT